MFFSPERQTSPLRIALAFAVVLVPYSVIGPFAGVLLDRWSRQRVLVGANAVRALGCLPVAALVLAGRDDAVFLVGALALIGVNRFVLSGLSASLPHVVRPDRLVTGNAVATTLGTVATAVGTGLGIGLRLVVGSEDRGVSVVVVAAAGGYAAAALLASLLLRRDQLGPDLEGAPPSVTEAVRSVGRGFLEGARHLRELRAVRAALVVLAAYRLAFGIVTVTAVLAFRLTLNAASDPDAGLADLGVAFALAGAGVLVGAVTAPWLARRVRPEGVVVLALVLAAGGWAVLGTAYTVRSLWAAAFVVSVAGQALKVCVDALVQGGVEDVFRGRVFGIYDLLFNVAFVVGGLAAAVLAPSGGRSVAAVLLATGCWAGAAVAYARARR